MWLTLRHAASRVSVDDPTYLHVTTAELKRAFLFLIFRQNPKLSPTDLFRLPPPPQTSSELLEEDCRDSDAFSSFAGGGGGGSDDAFSSGSSRPRLAAHTSRNSLSASFSTATTPTTQDHQHEPQRERRPSPTFPPMPEVANSRSYETPDGAEDSVAGDGNDGGDARGGDDDRLGGAGGSWAIDNLSGMSESFSTESEVTSSTGAGGTSGTTTSECVLLVASNNGSETVSATACGGGR